MAFNPIGSNRKPRSTLIFNSTECMMVYKNTLADSASLAGVSPTELVADLVNQTVAKTPEGQWVAHMMYMESKPCCMEAYQCIFSAIDEDATRAKRETRPIVQSFLAYTRKLGITIDSETKLVHHLREQWKSAAGYLVKKTDDLDADGNLRLENFLSIGHIIDNDNFSTPAAPMVTALLETWDLLNASPVTYRILLDLSRMGKPARRGIRENAADRVSLLKLIDDYYLDGKEETT